MKPVKTSKVKQKKAAHVMREAYFVGRHYKSKINVECQNLEEKYLSHNRKTECFGNFMVFSRRLTRQKAKHLEKLYRYRHRAFREIRCPSADLDGDIIGEFDMASINTKADFDVTSLWSFG